MRLIRARAALAVSLLIVAIGLTALPRQSHAGEESILRIGTWNIQWLGTPEKRTGVAKKAEQKPENLADYIEFSEVDIFAVQEITATDDAPAGFPAWTKNNRILKATQEILNRKPGREWKHLLFPPADKDDASKHQQWVGIVWNAKRVTLKGDVFPIPVANDISSQGEPLWKRNAYAAFFSCGDGKTDFLMMPVHLKSNRNTEKAKKKFDGRKHREEELQELLKHVDKIKAKFPGEADWVFVGDTNILDKTEKAIELLGTMGLRDMNGKDYPTHLDLLSGKLKRPEAPFDRLFVAKTQPEFQDQTQQVIRRFLAERNLKKSDFIRDYSDHLMVLTRIKIMADDD